MTSPGNPPHPAVVLHHAAGVCPVYIGSGLLAQLPLLTERHLPDRRLVVISDDRVTAAVPHPLQADQVTFPAGESSKSRSEWARLTDAMFALGADRQSAVVALGGGVTADLAGFVAATFMRGVPVLQVPTSLLAMLDAAVGGKTGLDVPAGKNLVGAFHQPAAVVMDPLVLATLPEQEFRAGLAEAVKHAAIADQEHFAWLGAHSARILARDGAALEALVRRSVEIKVEVVTADEREGGRRAVLNAGHTVAHALEAATGYTLRHGEAVAIGLVLEARLGERAGLTAAGTSRRVADLLERLGLDTALPPFLDLDAVLPLTRADKKGRRGEIRFALLADIGRVAGGAHDGWTQAVTEQAVRETLEQSQESQRPQGSL